MFVPGAGGVPSKLWRTSGSGRTQQLFLYAGVTCLVLLGLQVAFATLLDAQPGRIATTLVDAAAESAAAVACFWTAWRYRGAERLWRLLMGVATAGMAVASVGWAAMLVAEGRPFSHSSLGLVAFVLVPSGVAMAGLLSLPTEPVRGPGMSGEEPCRGRFRRDPITLLDCALVVGSIVVLGWGSVLASLVRVRAYDPVQFEIAVPKAVVSLILAVMLALIASFRRSRSPAVLALLGTGLLIDVLTSIVFLYGALKIKSFMPPWALIGYSVAYLLVFLAALVPVRARQSAHGSEPPGGRVLWMHAMLPYAVLSAAGVLVLAKVATETRLDRFETYGMVGLLLLALVRQMVTLAENTRLLAEIREREQRLHHQAFHDPLTGLANRALFTRRLQGAFAHDSAVDGYVGDGTPISVLFLDLDKFKQVNDTYGHAAGDDLLRISADRLRAGTRAVDTVARLGGDEFAVILDGDAPDTPRRIGERLAAAVQAPCLLAGQSYTPRASLGLVTLDGSAVPRPANPDTLLHQADLAMYAAKRERAGRLVVFQPDLASHANQSDRA